MYARFVDSLHGGPCSDIRGRQVQTGSFEKIHRVDTCRQTQSEQIREVKITAPLNVTILPKTQDARMHT